MSRLINNIKNRTKGFTFIELLVAVVILSVLAAIAIPEL
ncbi:type IV pilin protein [Chloroflexota bacterium]